MACVGISVLKHLKEERAWTTDKLLQVINNSASVIKVDVACVGIY